MIKVDTEQLVVSITKLVRRKRRTLLQAYGHVNDFSQKSKFSTNVVTKLDLEIERYLEKYLTGLLPGVPFVGEETAVDIPNDDIFWLVDPIDGTSHFVRGLPFCTTNIALILGGEVVLSVIYNFVTDEVYTATIKGGSFRNGMPIQVSNRHLQESLISYDINFKHQNSLNYFQALETVTGGLFNSLNCGYELTMIASGKLDGKVFILPHAKQWDYAAGSLLITEAGGMVCDIENDSFTLRSSKFYVSNQIISPDLGKLFSTL